MIYLLYNVFSESFTKLVNTNFILKTDLHNKTCGGEAVGNNE